MSHTPETLYYAPGACSMAVHVALNECNATFDLKRLDMMAGDSRKPEFLKINPRGQVPVLIEGDHVIREGAAILIHVLEKYKSPLLPTSGMERTEALEWLMFGNSTLHPAYARCFFLNRNAQDEKAKDQLLTTAVEMINKLWAEVEERLAKRSYLCGEQITIADILLAVIANWGKNISKPIHIGPHTRRMIERVIERPAYQKAMKTEQVEYKIAA